MPSKEEKVKKDKEESEQKAFHKGSMVVTAGYGYPNLYKAIYKAIFVGSNSGYVGNTTYDYSIKGIGPAFLKFEYGVTKLIGLGVAVGYSNMTLTETETYNEDVYNSSTGNYQPETYKDVFKYVHTSLSVGARLNFHFATSEKLDPYAGVAAGYSYKTNTVSFTTTNPSGTNTAPYSFGGYVPVYFAISAGLRYYFTPNIGIYGEVGFDKWSLLQGGAAIKF